MSAAARCRPLLAAAATVALAAAGLAACTESDSGVGVSRSEGNATGVPAGPDATTASGASAVTSPTGDGTSDTAAPDETTRALTIDDLALADLTGGLGALPSYHQELVIAVTTAGTTTSLESTSADVWPGLAFVGTDSTTADGATTSHTGGFIAETTFSAWDGGMCAVSWAAGTAAMRPGQEPALRLPPLLTMTAGATTTVEGRPATTFTGTTVEGAEAGTASVILDDTGVVLMYDLTLSAGQVEVTYTYSLSSIGALAEPALPAGCAEPLTGIPAVDGATSIRRMPGALDFATALDPAAVVDFYRTTLPTLGWSLDGEATADPVHQRMWFRDADGAEAVVLVTTGASGTWVDVTVRPVSVPAG